ncbi:hypothetical protein BofuT4_P152320.1 [Botrytis cinerea T4]|uniref:Uncharacterized protein n=1 Tax=Botryotinia fuckeliana (strain T4) TaxID=999810 RepID=G2YWV2_BOTF4|nr:hypothetical protein BofuT4_P152320.1 [Botrytis cinerea T4]
MPSTPLSTEDATLIINRPRPPTWVFLPPSDESESASDSDALPPYPPPPTRPPPRTPLTPPAQTHISSPANSNSSHNSYEYRYDSTSTINHELKSSTAPNKENSDVPPFCKALFFDSLQTNFDSLGPPSPSVSPSVSPSSTKSSTPQPWFHPISHRRFSRASPPQTRDHPPVPLIQGISALEFHTNSRSPDYISQKPFGEEDINDWVIIPPDIYSISPSPSSPSNSAAPILHKTETIKRAESRGSERKMNTLGYLFNFLMSTKGYTSTGTLKLAYQEEKDNDEQSTKDLSL